jgi:uncharacterized membrane protein YoaK (UPF0700 family)
MNLRPRPAAALQALHGAVVDERDGPLPVFLVALTVMVGSLDATTILVAHVFVSAMTGNVVFLGLALTGAHGFSVLTLCLALGGFLVGSLIGRRACRLAPSHRGQALRNVMAVKLVLATSVTVVVTINRHHLGTGVIRFMVAALACSMGAQLVAIRYLNVRDVPTIVVTMVLTGLLFERWDGLTDPAALRRVIALLAFFAGVLVGGLLVHFVAVPAALGFGLAILIAVSVAAHIETRDQSPWANP